MTLKKIGLLMAALCVWPAMSWCAPAKAHVVALGAAKREPYSLASDPSAKKDETELRVRPLIVDGKVKEWTTGEAHDVTDRSFAVRRAVRLNDALPTDKTERWVWQRGPWLLVDRTTGKVAAVRLPDFDPVVSEAVWFRDYAAYCGVNTSGKQLFAVVAQVQGRRPLLARKLAAWDPADHPTPVCAPAAWQRTPLKVSFQVTGAETVSFDLVGTAAVLVEEDDSDPN